MGPSGISALLLLSSALAAHGLAVGTRAAVPTGHAAPCSRVSPLVMADTPEYSSRVKMTVETKTPFRQVRMRGAEIRLCAPESNRARDASHVSQARIFFLYPSTIAAASIGLYVAITRLVAGLGGFRDE